MSIPVVDPSDSAQPIVDTETYLHFRQGLQLQRRIEFLSDDDHDEINEMEELLPESTAKTIMNGNITDLGYAPQELDKFRMKDSNSRNLDGKWSKFHNKRETNKANSRESHVAKLRTPNGRHAVGKPEDSCSRIVVEYASSLRGGGDEKESTKSDGNVDYSGLYNKLCKYKQQILSDNSLDNEYSLYVEPLVHSHHSITNSTHEVFELDFYIRTNFLGPHGDTELKVLLLIGPVGIGKSLFCKRLQNEILSDWESPHDPTLCESQWFAIYIPLSSLKKSMAEAITETLERELFLTEEEIKVFQNADPSQRLLPQFVFILDGYDEHLQNIRIESLKNKADYVKNNFYEANKLGEQWKNAKIVVTCREENLCGIKRKDLLFAPLDEKFKEDSSEPMAAVPGSFLQRRIELLSDEQITSYLKKYCYVNPGAILIPETKSWSCVERLSKIIDFYQVREFARVPFLLWVIANVLPGLPYEEDKETVQSTALSKSFLIETFIDQMIKATFQHKSGLDEATEHHETHAGDEEQILRKIKDQLQKLALRLSNYERSKSVTETQDEKMLLELYPLVCWDENLSEIRFRQSIFQEFFVTRSLIEEINEVTNSKLDEKNEPLEDVLLNQKLLKHDASSYSIASFLRDAVRDEKITSNQLLYLIQLSKQPDGSETSRKVEETEESKIDWEEQGQHPIANGKDPEKSLNLKETKDNELQNEVSPNWLSPWSVAAANAITILNFTGYDFSKQDLSDISIPGAILCHGTFEGTNFAKSNLQGVDFSGSCLENTIFIHSNMRDVNFGKIPSLSLKKDTKSITYSPNGKYLAVDITEQTILFKSSADGISFHLKGIRSFPGKFASKISQPFSKDERKIVTFTETKHDNREIGIQLQIWDISSGQLLQKFELPIGDIDVLHFSPDLKGFILCKDGDFIKCDLSSKGPLQHFIQPKQKTYRNDYKFNEKLLLVGVDLGVRIHNLVTGKLIYTQRQRHTYYSEKIQLSSHRHQFVSATDNYAFLADYIRGNMLKDLKSRKVYSSSSLRWPVGLDGRSTVIERYDSPLCIQDLAHPADFINPLHPENPKIWRNYFLRADGEQIAVVNKTTISLFNLLPNQQNALLKGIYNKGLSLLGANISGSRGLSDENIRIFRDKKGYYYEFEDEVIKNCFLCSSKDAEKIQELSLVDAKLTNLSGLIIAKESRWPNLRKLDLSENRIGDDAGEAIAKSKTWKNLEELILSSTGIGSKTVSELIQNETWKNLKKLHLRANKIYDSHVGKLAECKIWVNLEDIDLSHNEITAKGAETLGNNTIWTQLKSLNLNSNDIRSAGAEKICQNTTWKNLQVLDLGCNSIDASGVAGLCQNQIWNKLVQLDLGSNPLFTEGALLLSENINWVNLEVLNLYYHALGDRGVERLSKNAVWSNLKTLNLGRNSIFTQGAVELSKNTTWKKLETLILVFNGLGDEGVRELSKNSSWVNLKKLDLGDNFITDVGAIELSKNTAWVNLQTLILTKNKITEEQANTLKVNPTWKLLENLEY